MGGTRRWAVRLAAIALCLFVLTSGCRPAFADEEPRGFWRLDASKTKVETHEDTVSPPYSTTYAATELSHFKKEKGEWSEYVDGVTVTGPHISIFETTCTPPPTTVEGGGDCVFTLTMTLAENSRVYYHFNDHASIRRDIPDMNIGGVYVGYVDFVATEEDAPDSVSIAAVDDWDRTMDAIPDAGLREGAGVERTATVHNTFPNYDSEQCCVYFSSSGIQTVWTYEWVDTEVAPTEDEEVQEVRDPLVEQDVTTEASNVPGSQEAGIVSRVFSAFDPTEGGIWEIVGPVSVVVVGGVAYRVWRRRRKKGTGDKGEKGKREEKPTVTYRMVVSKDFGSALRPGGKPRVVRARIEESKSVAGGTPSPFVPSTKTSDIRGASENNLEVAAGPVKGDDKCFFVSVPRDGAGRGDPVLKLSIEGAGGFFSNHVRFRLVADPRLEFVRGKGDASGLEPNARDLVGVAGATARVRFKVIDSVGEPSGFAFVGDEGLRVTVEPIDGQYLTYEAVIENRDHTIEKRAGVFADLEERSLTIRALFEDEPEARGDVRLTIWPDGVSVHAGEDYLREDALEVKTMLDFDRLARGEAMPMPRVPFDLYCAYVDERGAHVARNPRGAEFAGPLGGERHNNMFRENFTLKVEPDLSDTRHGFVLEPQNALPMLAEPYRVRLAVTVTLDDRELDADVPLTLMGDAPLKPSKVSKEVAIKRLRGAVESFGLAGDPQMKLQLRYCQEQSAAQIEFVHKAIIVQGQLFFEQYRLSQQRYADNCHQWTVVLGAVTKCCDFALEVIAEKQYPGCGGTVAKLTNPLRNMLATYLGMRYDIFGIDDSVRSDVPEDIDEQFVDSLLEGAQNGIENMMSAEKKPSVSVLADLVVAYLMIGFVRHYTRGPGKEKGDAYLSIIKTFADFGFAKLSSWLLGEFGKLVGKAAKGTYNLGKGVATRANKFIGERCAGVYRLLVRRDISRQLNAAGEEAYRRVINEAKASGTLGSALKDLGSTDALRSLKAQGIIKDLRNRAADAYAEARTTLVAEHNELLREGATNTAKAVTGWLNHVEKELDDSLGAAATKASTWLGEETAQGFKKGDLVDLVVAQTLNFELGGTKEGDALGTNSSEVIQAYLKERFNLTSTCDSAVEVVAAELNPYAINVRLDGAYLVFEACGGSARVDVVENLAQLGDYLFGSLYVWMFEMFDPLVRAIDADAYPDPRDAEVRDLRMMELQHERDSAILRRGTTEFSRDTFLPGSERPTFDTGIDPHRYMK